MQALKETISNARQAYAFDPIKASFLLREFIDLQKEMVNNPLLPIGAPELCERKINITHLEVLLHALTS